MKLLISMEPHNIVKIYEGDALAFVDDALNALYEFDCLQADTACLAGLWRWVTVDLHAMVFTDEEEKARLFDLFKCIHSDLERILGYVQPEESASESDEGESGNALHQDSATGPQTSSSDVLHHWV